MSYSASVKCFCFEVSFANNPLTGAVILMALLLGNPAVGGAAVLGGVVATFAAMVEKRKCFGPIHTHKIIITMLYIDNR